MHRPTRLDPRRRRRLLELIGAAVLVAAILIVSLAATNGGSSSAVPAFSAKQLASTPGNDWITNGGSISNGRYSSLDQIDTSNVAQLKGIWHVHLKSGAAAKYSGEAQPLEYKGVLYTVTGADDVYAIDAKTGATKWVFRSHLNQKITTVCCGWTSRGVAIGDGRVYLGRLDGKLIALNQKDGKIAWSTQVMPWQQGYTITSAPLYYDGRVYTGLSGGEFRIRGRVTAYDAESGKMLWRFYTIPGPSQVGHDSWPRTGDAWMHGGAPVWQTPAVDPDLGLLYFSTGNASPDLDGSKRAGDNLFASSIVAIDAKTGQYRWHFQEVHHDIWDYDAPSPVVLFDVTLNGKLVHGLGEPGKTGWEYLLDRETGKPLYGITERPVPQSTWKSERTSPTQPVPDSGAFVPHTVSAAGLKAARQAAAAALSTKGAAPKIVAGPIFSPPSHGGTIHAFSPGSVGGSDWPPSSYNPTTQLIYVCGQTSVGALVAGTQPEHANPGEQQVGSVFTGSLQDNPGVLAAIDARSGRLVWERHFSDACYSGSVTTAGNLVFVGRNQGQLQAYDAANGGLLWSFQTGAGANSVATVFKRGSKEVIAFYAAGNAVAGTAHGDNLWLFGLDGTLGPVAAAKAPTTAQPHAGEAKTKAASTVQVQGGEFFFKLSSQTAKLGTVTFVFKNVGHVGHDFAIGGKSTPVISPGHTAKLTVTFTKAGSYPYLCTVPGHASAGMKGVLRVA
jgi:quinohemoprotein ethanol dehydrogenase